MHLLEQRKVILEPINILRPFVNDNMCNKTIHFILNFDLFIFNTKGVYSAPKILSAVQRESMQ